MFLQLTASSLKIFREHQNEWWYLQRTEDAYSKLDVKIGWNVTKTVLLLFFCKKPKGIVKLNILLCLDTINILSPNIWINENFSLIWAYNLGAQTDILAYKTLWIRLWFFNPLMPGGNKVTHTQTNLQLKTAGLLKYVTFLLPPGIKGLICTSTLTMKST